MHLNSSLNRSNSVSTGIVRPRLVRICGPSGQVDHFRLQNVGWSDVEGEHHSEPEHGNG